MYAKLIEGNQLREFANTFVVKPNPPSLVAEVDLLQRRLDTHVLELDSKRHLSHEGRQAKSTSLSIR